MQKKEDFNINYRALPYDLVFDVLLHLPEEDIYDNAMLVCRRWSHIIRSRDFVNAHRARHSTPGLLILDYSLHQKGKKTLGFCGNETRQNRDCRFASCNGLILEYDNFSKRAHKITNPEINQRFVVPPIYPQMPYHRFSSIAYSAASMEYKVVYIYDRDEDASTLRCVIATVGVDNSRRDVCTQHLSPEAKGQLYRNKTTTTEGFAHWTDAKTHTLVLTLNVETETFTQYPVPQGQDNYGDKYYLSTGKSLTLFDSGSNFFMEVWEMKLETGEWTKMYKIDLEAQKCNFEHFRSKGCSFPFALKPVGWLKYREVLVLRFSHMTRFCVAYNVLTKEFDYFKL
ncbi:hypothetical protein MIMGU_mgv1a017669mg, partial [Erythranthe guttata]